MFISPASLWHLHCTVSALLPLIWHCHPVHHCVLKLDFQQGGEIKTCSPLHCTGTREGSSHFLVAEAAGGKGCTGSVSACFVVVVNPSSSEHGCFLFVLLLLLFLHPENHITFLFHFHCFSSRQLPRNNTWRHQKACNLSLLDDFLR